MSSNKKELSEFIKSKALELGFDACGIAKAEFLEEDSVFYNGWIERGFHAKTSYLERNLDKRFDPRIMVDECKSIVVVLLNYFPAGKQKTGAPKIAKYAFSKVDYHTVIKNKLKQLEQSVMENYGSNCFNTGKQHLFVDSAPILERRWAQKAGLGWIGKNKMLINKQLGSFFFIGTLFLNIETEHDKPYTKNGCGNCIKCIDNCPTRALQKESGLDTRKCISYQTIEKKGDIEEEIGGKLSNFIFGCDICNDVCPWNKSKAKPHQENDLETIPEIIDWNEDDWKNLTLEKFNQIFKESAINRAGFEKLKQTFSHTNKT